MKADKLTYLLPEVKELLKVWPDNHTMNFVFHGHSIPAGYTANHVIRPFDAYPHLVHRALNKRFPCAVINPIITAIGGENSISGAKRFKEDVLPHKPVLVTIDYERNDMFENPDQVKEAWRSMIEDALKEEIKVMLITPVVDCQQLYYDQESRTASDEDYANMIRKLADEYGIALADPWASFEQLLKRGADVHDYLTYVNHPNVLGHQVIADEIMRWFPFSAG